MSIVRVTTITFDSKENTANAVKSYVETAPSNFPEAEQLLAIHTVENIAIYVSLFVVETMSKALNSTWEWSILYE